MKKKLLLLFILFSSTAIIAQVNPTLAVGLEKLTMNKGTIDVEVLTEIIMSKQKELKQEALKRFMFKLFPEANFTTKYYVQNCLNVLLNEKNPQVIEKEILELTTNYSLSLGVAYAILELHDQELIDANLAYIDYRNYSPYYQDMIIKKKENQFKKYNRRERLNDSIIHYEVKVDKILDNIDTAKEDQIANLVLYRKKALKFKNKLARWNLRKNAINTNDQLIDEKKRESIEMIDEFSLNPDVMQIDSASQKLLKTKNYIIKNSKDESILSLSNYLWDINNSLENLTKRKKELNKSENNNKRESIQLAIDDERSALEVKVKNLTKEYLELPIELPFGIILDVVSLSLSDIPELQKKGFFKNKIDYRTSEFYLDLLKSYANNKKKNTASKTLRESLDNMKLHVCKKITPYVSNYDIINEFLKRNKGKHVNDIINDMKSEITVFIPANLAEQSWIKKYPQIVTSVDQIKKLQNSINNLESSKISFTPIKINPLNCSERCEKIKISSSEQIEQLQASLNNLQSSVSNEEADIKKSMQTIINFNPTKLITLSDKNISKLNPIILDSTSLEAVQTMDKLIVEINNNIDLYNRNKSKNLFIKILDDGLKLEKEINTLPQRKDIIENVKILDLLEFNYLQVNIPDFNKKIDEINNQVDTLVLSITTSNKQKETKIETIKKQKERQYEIIAESDGFYNEYLMSVLNKIENEKLFKTDSLDTLTISKASEIFPKIYSKVKSLVNNQDIHMSDIVYLDDYITDKMIELKIRDKQNDVLYDSIISQTKVIIPLLKMRALENIKEIVSYDQELMNLFEFISNLNKLDEAETYQSIVNMLRDGSKKVENNLTAGEFKDGYVLFINAMKKYTLINPSEEYVEIDVVSFLNDLQQYYNRNNKAVFSLYMSLGLDQNFFFKNFKVSDTETINNISFASEKIGVKWRIANFKRFEGYENVVKDDVYLNKKAPFINEIYSIIYGSGLLYTLANTTTNENFDFPHVGMGVGMRFYNALDVNLILGFPFVKNYNFGDNAFYGIGLDIPLGEYLEKLGSKNK